MKYKNLFFVAGALMALAACSDNFADAPPVVTPPAPEPEEPAILFGLSSGGSTRAEFTGAVAAEMLGKKFVVTGYKGSKTATVGSVVFDNYVVKYIENSANTTESNTRNWEYVGVDRIKHSIDKGITRQSIKYWDYTYPQYDFIAWSTGKKTAIYEEPSTGIPAGSVYVSAIDPTSATGEEGAAFFFKGKAADLQDCYIADLVTVKKAQYGDTPVTIKFRSLGSKVRIGIYETIPGYSVRNVKFYSAAASNDASSSPRIFTTSANNIFTEGVYTIYYPTVDNPDNADNNQAHVKFSGTGSQSSVVDFGTLQYTIAEEGEKTEGAVYLGRTSSSASFAGEAEGNFYTQYLPNESGTNLNLRVDYTLESIDGSGEVINVRGATAQVPLIYTQWKPGIAYTYLFKISDKTNGYTGAYDPTRPDDITVNSDPAGLYPITFDAVVVNAEDGDNTQETITLVSTPTITTYQEGSNVVNGSEYSASTGSIYVTVNDGKKDDTPDLSHGSVQKLAGKASLYKLPAGKAYTEAEVVDALQYRDDHPAEGTILGRNGLELTEAEISLTGRVNYGVDGNPIIVGADKVARFTPTAGTTYAFVYTKKAATETPQPIRLYQAVSNPLSKEGDVITNYWRYAYNWPTGDVQKGVTYISPTTGLNVPVFLGQEVGSVYLRENTGTAENPVYSYAPASGYAVTGTEYYYTPDRGMSFKKAANIPYADFADATDLYTFDGSEYSLKTGDSPVDGTAYYQKKTVNSQVVYTYCVILPQQADGLQTLKYNEMQECMPGEVIIPAQTYFDCYYVNDGVYYVKIIKVQ